MMCLKRRRQLGQKSMECCVGIVASRFVRQVLRAQVRAVAITALGQQARRSSSRWRMSRKLRFNNSEIWKTMDPKRIESVG